MPPITTVASGRCTSAPTPVLNAIGTKPRLATRAVISTGLNRCCAPSNTASFNGSPSRSSCRMNVSMTTPFKTATPDSAMKPTAAEIDSGISRSANANIPPVSPKGTPVNMTSALLSELNALYSRPIINSSANGTTKLNRWEADCSCSKVPS